MAVTRAARKRTKPEAGPRGGAGAAKALSIRRPEIPISQYPNPYISLAMTEQKKTPYPVADPSPSFPKLEEAIGAIWKKENTFQRSIEQRRAAGAKEFVFYDGPPF